MCAWLFRISFICCTGPQIFIYPETCHWLVYLSSFSCFLAGLFFPSVDWVLSPFDKQNQSIEETCRCWWSDTLCDIFPFYRVSLPKSRRGWGWGWGVEQWEGERVECECIAEELMTTRSPEPLHASWLRCMFVAKHIFTWSCGSLHCSPPWPPTVFWLTLTRHPTTCRRGQRAIQGADEDFCEQV